MAELDWLNEALNNVGKEVSTSTGFAPGAHTVHIGMAEGMKDSKDRDIIKVIVLGDNDEEGEATLWLHSPGGAKMAITKVLGILVHNVPEDKKATISEYGKRVFANVKEPSDTKEHLLKILNEKLIGKEAYIYAEPQEKYDTTKYVDLWHYDQSKRAPAAAPAAKDNVIDNVDAEQADIPDDLFA
jgi:hypothetical protein